VLVDAGVQTVYAGVQECLLRNCPQQRQQSIRSTKRRIVLVHHLVGVDFKRYTGRTLGAPDKEQTVASNKSNRRTGHGEDCTRRNRAVEGGRQRCCSWGIGVVREHL
jgi:hypothetical protein